VLVVSAAVFIDTMFYAVISPLLPELSHQLALSKLSAGVMTASYPAGMLVGSLPGGMLAVRTGPRFSVCVGLLMLVVSTVAFGWLNSAPGLDLARFMEGVGGACSWAGGIAWLVAATPVERRGAVIGNALALAIGGSLFGPAIGAVASAAGRPALFTVLAMSGLALTAFVRTVPDQTESSGQGVAAVIKVMGRPPLVRAMWLMVLPAMVSGVVNVLAPLQLHKLGAGAGAIGATFLVGAGLEAIVSAWVGHLSDRHGRLLPMRLGLVGTAVTVGCFTLPGTALELSLLVMLVCVVLGGFWAPAMALLSDVGASYGIDQAHAAALMNLGWAAGQIVGALGGGATGNAYGDGFAALTTAALCVLSITATRRSTVPGQG
jgi:MFS family permease